MNIQELLQIKHIKSGLIARTLSFFKSGLTTERSPFCLEKKAPDVIFPVL